MKASIFREYDIRGVVGNEFLIDQTYALGLAILTFLKQKHPDSHTLVIGRDARVHSAAIANELVTAAMDLGFSVIDIGLCPTPVVYFGTYFFKTQIALIVTASHNPKEYNGIKIWGAWGSQIQEMRKIFESKTYQITTTTKGSYKTHDLVSEYINYLSNHFKHLQNKEINAVIDCGNGAAGTVLPGLITSLNLKNIKLFFVDPDGNFPNHEADPTVPENMQSVKQELATNTTITVGLGFDGDCDRMNPMTKKGVLVAGDKLLALFAQKTLLTHPGATVVFDIKSSGGLIELLTQWHAKPFISPSGHALIKKAMLEQDAKLAGELSCHFFFHDRYFGYDDGMYAALRLFEILAETDKSLDELLEIFPRKESSPEIRIKCSSDDQKVKIVEHVKQIFAAKKDSNLLTIDGVRASMHYGWGLLRASNTQPVICLRFESATKEGFNQVKNDFLQALKPYFDEHMLHEYFDRT